MAKSTARQIEDLLDDLDVAQLRLALGLVAAVPHLDAPEALWIALSVVLGAPAADTFEEWVRTKASVRERRVQPTCPSVTW